jgi:hypothetical protein
VTLVTPLAGATGATAMTGAADIRITLEILAPNAPVPASVSARDAPEPAATVIHRSASSAGISAPSRARTDTRARFSSCRTAPLLAPSSAAISS